MLPRSSIQLVVPAPPGSQPDTLARWISEPLAQGSGLVVSVVNRPGAAGALAADAVLGAPPESGSLLLGGLDHVAYSHLNSERKPLDPLVDFVPVGAVNRDTWVLMTAADQPTKTLAALAERSLSLAGGFSYASNGEGSTAHLLTARLCKALGINAPHVPYKESWMPDLIAGRIHFAIAPTPVVLGQTQAAKLHAITTLTDERLPLLPGTPSIGELGWPGQVFYGGLFLFALASLSIHARRINAWLVATLRRPEIMQRYREAAIETTTLDLAQTAEAVRQRLQLIDSMRLATFGRTR